jgi:hypothetical protein
MLYTLNIFLRLDFQLLQSFLHKFCCFLKDNTPKSNIHEKNFGFTFIYGSPIFVSFSFLLPFFKAIFCLDHYLYRSVGI